MSKTKEKYMNAMLYASAQPEFHSREFAKTFKISHNVITAMHELGLIQKVGNGKYCWVVRRAPLSSDVVAIRKRLAAYNTIARQSNGQLSIKPLKRVEYKAPVQTTDVDVINYDRTNNKMLIILAVGTIIGFLIATTIWK
jgi:hypothetical protein